MLPVEEEIDEIVGDPGCRIREGRAKRDAAAEVVYSLYILLSKLSNTDQLRENLIVIHSDRWEYSTRSSTTHASESSLQRRRRWRGESCEEAKAAFGTVGLKNIALFLYSFIFIPLACLPAPPPSITPFIILLLIV